MSKGDRFLALHRPGTPLLMPNAWDKGSAALFAGLGVEALATTSGGFAATHARLDGSMSRDEVLAHCADIVSATELPVSADLENCFAHDPDGVAATIAAAKDVGLAGGSVEDFTGDSEGEPIYELSHAADRVRAAAEAAHGGKERFVLTARAENYLHGHVDLADTIARLQAYQEAGADVLFAPRVVDPTELRRLLAAVDLPVNVLITPNAPSIGELAGLGVSRISVGGAIAVASYGFAITAVKQLQEEGRPNYWEQASSTRALIEANFSR